MWPGPGCRWWGRRLVGRGCGDLVVVPCRLGWQFHQLHDGDEPEQNRSGFPVQLNHKTLSHSLCFISSMSINYFCTNLNVDQLILIQPTDTHLT